MILEAFMPGENVFVIWEKLSNPLLVKELIFHGAGFLGR